MNNYLIHLRKFGTVIENESTLIIKLKNRFYENNT